MVFEKDCYYFVKFRGEDKWTVAQHDGSTYMPFTVVGTDEIFDKSIFSEIGSKVEMPE